MPWYEFVAFVALGLVVGTYGTMVGVGGGFLMVPVFLFMHQPAKVAAGTSLAVVLVNSVSGTLQYLRQRRVDLVSGLIFSIAGIPGALLGAYADQFIPHRVFTILFGVLLLVVGARILLVREKAESLSDDSTPQRGAASAWHIRRDFDDAHGVRHSYRYSLIGGIAISVATGFLASLFGIGGGVVQVPAMVYLFGFPAHVATATSQFIIAVTSFFGTASHLYYGDVLPLPALALALGAIAGAPLGAFLALRMKAAPLMRWLSLAILFAAIYLIVAR
jgi:uncharacterized membrane protein YfcA